MILGCSSISRISTTACVRPPRSTPRSVLVAGRPRSLRRNDNVRPLASSSRQSVNMTLISGSLSSYDDPHTNPIDPAPTCFQLLAVAHAALGLYMLLRPEAVIQTVYAASAGNSLVTSLMVLLGGMHVYASVFSHALHGAAENSRLDSTTYQRLAFGLGAWSFVSMGVIAFAKSQLTTVYANAYAGLFCRHHHHPIRLCPWPTCRVCDVEADQAEHHRERVRGRPAVLCARHLCGMVAVCKPLGFSRLAAV